MRRPEIMSPAGHWPELNAAVEAGTDAVYFGLTHFTARAKVGFSLDDLHEVFAHLHSRGVRGYVTLNTLIFDDELALMGRTIAAVADAGADAIIIQDPAVAALARQIAPGLALHGSTQMSITSIDGIELARQQFGVSRVVLARELSLQQIGGIAAATDCQLEMFVHGALCVSYSGQCFSSEAWGGRSANRGQCAQTCRLPYDLLVDDQVRPLGEARYLLSPQDLYALELIPEIVELGVTTLKIEGRYKGPDYVALTTRAYRQAVDAACDGVAPPDGRRTRLELEQVFSRGLGPHFVSGTDHQAVIDGRSPRHRGVQVGRVTHVQGERIVVTPEANVQHLAPLKAGDGVVFDAADWRSPQQHEEGGRLYSVTPVADDLELGFGNNAVDTTRIRRGDWVWRTSDINIERRARPYTQATTPQSRQPLDVQVTAHVGAPLRCRWSLSKAPQISVKVATDNNLEPAREHGVTAGFLRQQLGRLGNTPYELADLELDGQGNPFVPASLLGPLRRQAVAALQEAQRQTTPRRGADPASTVAAIVLAATSTDGLKRTQGQTLRSDRASGPTAQAARSAADLDPAQARVAESIPAAGSDEPPQLHLLVRTPDQLSAATAIRPASITLDYLDLHGLRPALEQVRDSGIPVRVASPRVLKPGEEGFVRLLLKLECAILVRSGGLLQALRTAGATVPLIGDFSLNAANLVTASQLLQLGLQRLTPTHDLDAAQIEKLARSLGGQHLEVIAYQHLPVFHTEHCVFCRFLSNGSSSRDCGRPCETHRVALRDHSSRVHPVLADVGCRNTVFGAQAQQASRHLANWRAAGIHHLRLEFAHESGEQVEQVTRAFRDSLDGTRTARQLQAILQDLDIGGTTEGSLLIVDNDMQLPVL